MVQRRPVIACFLFSEIYLLIHFYNSFVYLTVKLLKNLHLFYLNRILRMFPLLATIVLLQASILHYIHDGPNWHSVADIVEQCRINWWSTLLYVQNYVRPVVRITIFFVSVI